MVEHSPKILASEEKATTTTTTLCVICEVLCVVKSDRWHINIALAHSLPFSPRAWGIADLKVIKRTRREAASWLT